MKTGLESSLAASAGMNLRFNDDARTAAGDNFIRRRPHLGERFGGDFERDGDAVSDKQLFGLIFVDIHLKIEM